MGEKEYLLTLNSMIAEIRSEKNLIYDNHLIALGSFLIEQLQKVIEKRLQELSIIFLIAA